MPELTSSEPVSTESIKAGEAYRRLLIYAQPYWAGFVVAVIGMIIMAASEAGFALLMAPMLDGGFVNKDPQFIKLVPIALLGIFFLRGIGSFVSNYVMVWIGRNVIRDLRYEMFGHLLQLPASYYDKTSKGEITSKLIFDVERVANAATSAITIIVRDTFTVVALLSVMIYLSWQLSLFFLLVVPVMALIIVSISSRFRRISHNIQSSMGDVTQVTQQLVETNRIAKIYGAQKQEQQSFAKANNDNRRQNMRLALTKAVSVPISEFFGAFALAGMLYFATQESMLESVTVGVFMSFVMASMRLLAPLKKLTQITAELQQGVAAAQSVFTLLDRQKEIDTGQIEKDHVKGDIQFDSVSFTYSADKGEVLTDINLNIHAGQTVAIVGRSGGGKSSLVDLIPRFYDFDRGEILLDGENIKHFKLANLRQHISLVNQDVTLFNDSIETNIVYGTHDKVGSVDQKRLEQASRAAHAWEFIQEKPEGMATNIGDRGALLSGGQRQRVAIARAIYKDAPILILDEATSALDTETERFIQQALEELMKGRTTFIIAHRLSTVENADMIVVMHEGKIVETGDHKTLLKKGKHYAALHNMSFQETQDST